jgi:Glycosyl transferases group 1
MKILYLGDTGLVSRVLRQGLVEELGPDAISETVPAAEADLVVLGFREVDLKIARQTIKKLVVVDGSDSTDLWTDTIEALEPDVYFKTALYAGPFPQGVAAIPLPMVVPLLMAVPVDPPPAPTGDFHHALVPKNIDVLFLGGFFWCPIGLRRRGNVTLDSRWRDGLKERLEREAKASFSFLCLDTAFEFMSREKLDLIQRAKIVVCVGDRGVEPLQTYETLFCPETLLVRERIPVAGAHAPVDGVHCAMFDTKDGSDYEELVRVVRRYLQRDDERLLLARRGNALLREHHTARARARQFLKAVFDG